MTESLQPLIDEADKRLVLIKLSRPITSEDCDDVAAEVAGADANPFTLEHLAAVLKRKWVIDLPPGWYPQLLDLDGDVEIPQPELTHRQDGAALFYPARVHLLFGEPEAGKTWVALLATAEELAKGGQVLYIDFEMSEQSIAARLKMMGVQNRPLYLNPPGPLDEDYWSGLALFLKTEGVTLVVIDAVTEVMTMHGWDPNSNQDAAHLSRFLRALARSGAAVVAIDHVAKSRETGARGPVGAGHKLAAADVALEVRAKERPDPARKGILHVFVTKDREGALRETANAAGLWAIVEIIPDDGMVLIQLMNPPEGYATSVQDGSFRPTYYMERVSEWVEAHDDGNAKPPSRNQIEKGVRGRQAYVRQAIDILAEEGYLEEIADGNARRYRFVKPYREGDDE